MQQNPEKIDGVFFHDELDSLAEFCDEHIELFDGSPYDPSEEQTTHDSLDSWDR